jgi:adenylate cyclase class 2
VKKPIEIEIKLPLESVASARALLRRHRFKVIAPRVFEENLILDDASRSLFNRGVLLRVRRAGKIVTCTSKGAEMVGGRHKRREEHEFKASDFDSTLAVFGALGYHESFRYEKYRTEFAQQGEPGHATLDETPIGVYMELEGPAAWIDRTAKLLGFPRGSWIILSYARLYVDWCEARGITPTNMRFKGSRPRGAAPKS